MKHKRSKRKAAALLLAVFMTLWCGASVVSAATTSWSGTDIGTSTVRVSMTTPLYKTANTSGEYHMILTAGTTLNYMSVNGSFYYVNYNGYYGYVAQTACSGANTGGTVSTNVTTNIATPLYRTASTTGEMFFTLSAGTNVGIVSTSGSFYYVLYNGYYGYVLISACTGSGGGATSSFNVSIKTSTPLYQAASTTSSYSVTLAAGISVGVINTQGSFYYVSYNSYYGYVPVSACTGASGGTVSFYVKTIQTTPLYKTASTTGETFGTLSVNNTLGVINTTGSFYYIYADGYYGYVLTSACTTTTGGTGTTISYYLKANIATPLYKTASTAAQTFGTVAAGTSVGVISTSGNFHYAYVDGYYGYILASACTNTGTGGTAVAYYVRTSYATPLYKTAALSGETYGTLTTGTSIGVINTSGNFYYVSIDGYYGYVLTAACTTNTGTLSAEVVASGTVIAGTTLYSTDSTSATPIGTISTGGKISIVSQTTTGFYYVKIGTYYGYVLSTAVTVTNDATVIPFTGDGPLPTSTINPTGTTTAGGLITITNNNTGAITAATTGTITNCNSWVSLRESATSASTRLAKVAKGSTVTIEGTSGSYTKVKYAGETGYILTYYIDS